MLNRQLQQLQKLQQLLDKVVIGDSAAYVDFRKFSSTEEFYLTRDQLDQAFLTYLSQQPDLRNCAISALADALKIYPTLPDAARPYQFITLLSPINATALNMIGLECARLLTNLGIELVKSQISDSRSQDKQDDEALELFKRAVAAGDNDALYCLGFMYEQGRVSDGNSEFEHDNKAIELYVRAINHGVIESLTALGFMHMMGRVRDTRSQLEHDKEAMGLFNRAISAGNIDALCYLGRLHEQGRIHHHRTQAEHIKEAMLLFNMAADAGQVLALAKLGDMYAFEETYDCLTQEQRDAKAIEYYNKAICAENSVALNNLALLYCCERVRDGRSKEQHLKDAVALFRRACDVGDYPEGFYNLASLLIDGKVYDGRTQAEQDSEAVLLLRHTMMIGESIDALYRLTTMQNEGRVRDNSPPSEFKNKAGILFRHVVDERDITRVEVIEGVCKWVRQYMKTHDSQLIQDGHTQAEQDNEAVLLLERVLRRAIKVGMSEKGGVHDNYPPSEFEKEVSALFKHIIYERDNIRLDVIEEVCKWTGQHMRISNSQHIQLPNTDQNNSASEKRPDEITQLKQKIQLLEKNNAELSSTTAYLSKTLTTLMSKCAIPSRLRSTKTSSVTNKPLTYSRGKIALGIAATTNTTLRLVKDAEEVQPNIQVSRRNSI